MKWVTFRLSKFNLKLIELIVIEKLCLILRLLLSPIPNNNKKKKNTKYKITLKPSLDPILYTRHLGDCFCDM